jgi:hypothetical protein
MGYFLIFCAWFVGLGFGDVVAYGTHSAGFWRWLIVCTFSAVPAVLATLIINSWNPDKHGL